MIRRLQKLCFFRKIGIQRIIFSIASGIVPKAEHRTHRNIHSAVCKRIVFLAVSKQIDDSAVNDNRCDARLIVNGLQVVHSIVGIINVKQLMVVEKLIVNPLGLFLKRFFTFRTANNSSNRIKKRKKGSGILVSLRLSRGACTYE